MIENKEEFRELSNECFSDFVRESCLVKDFPKPGVDFIDIFPILKDENQLLALSYYFGDSFAKLCFVPEARGFLFYSIFDRNSFIPLRKFGKLPGDVLGISYNKEYGSDTLFFQPSLVIDCLKDVPKGVVEVTFFDDICATGGTAEAFVDFISSLNLDGYTFRVKNLLFLLDIDKLDGIKKLSEKYPDVEVKSLYTYYD